MKVSYWLIPTAEGKAVFERVISELAKELKAPVFEPYVTVYSGEVEDENELMEILKSLRFSRKPMVLETKGIGLGETFTKSLFLEFEPSEDLQRLSDAIKMGSRRRLEYVLRPHLSLVYGDFDLVVKERMVKERRLAELVERFPRLEFDGIKVIATSSQTRSNKDVENWRVVQSMGMV